MAYHLSTAVFARQAPVHDSATAVESRHVVTWGQYVGNPAASQQNAAACDNVFQAQTEPGLQI